MNLRNIKLLALTVLTLGAFLAVPFISASPAEAANYNSCSPNARIIGSWSTFVRIRLNECAVKDLETSSLTISI